MVDVYVVQWWIFNNKQIDAIAEEIDQIMLRWRMLKNWFFTMSNNWVVLGSVQFISVCGVNDESQTHNMTKKEVKVQKKS